MLRHALACRQVWFYALVIEAANVNTERAGKYKNRQFPYFDYLNCFANVVWNG